MAATLTALMTGAGGAAGATGMAGGLAGALGSIYSGIQAKAGADFEAKQLKAKADEDFAIGQRRAMAARREKELALSRINAVAAASGAGADDDSVTALMEGVEEQGTYNSMTALYEGRSARNKAYGQAAQRKAEGRSALIGSILGAGQTAGSTIYGIYNRR